MSNMDTNMKTYPLLQSQMGVALEWIFNPAATRYNIPFHIEFPKRVTADRVRDALLRIIAVRDIFRLRIVQDENGDLRQFVDESMEIPVPVHKMTDEEAHDYISHRFLRPFTPFSAEPLVRFEVIEAESCNHLVFDFHHIIADGTSLITTFLMGELSASFNGDTIPPHTYSILDYAEEEQSVFASEDYRRAKEYYAQKFKGLSFTDIAGNTGNPWGNQIQSSEYVSVSEVEEWCKQHGTTSSLLFMAAFGFVLSKFSREDRVVYSRVTHGRYDSRIRNIYGMFVRNSPVMSCIDYGQSVIEYVKGHRAEQMCQREYTAYPFTHFCRDMGMRPSTTFAFQGMAMQEHIVVDGEPIQATQLPHGLTDEDLSCVIYASDTTFEMRVFASDALYSQSRIDTFAHAMLACVSNMMENPDLPLARLKITTPDEEQSLVALGRGEHLDYDTTQTWVDLFMAQAAKTPDALAVADRDTSLTYAELDRKSNALAHILIEKGVQPGDFVAVMLDRTVRFPLAVLAIHKAGAAYVPIDLEYPQERIEYMLEDSEARLVIDGAFMDSVSVEASFAEPINLATTEGLAYMIYTSGTTGKPKGAMVGHDNLRGMVVALVEAESITSDDRIVGHPSFSFDSHVMDMYPVLTVGGSFHIVPEDMRRDISDVVGFIESHRTTGGLFTPQFGQLLLTEDMSSMRYIAMGGEKLVGAYHKSLTIANCYGPTECTCCTMGFFIEPGKRIDNIPIGRPWAGVYAFVVDGHGHLVPRGVAGELCHAGVQICRGYWKRPEMTAEKFVDCPWTDGKMYHTGDLVRWNEDGQLEYLGRIDNQVKLRGFRIELGEIESKAAVIPGVKQVVAVVKHLNGADHLVLYYVPDSDNGITDEGVREALEASSLAEYMIPDAYVQLDALPMTPNGKVDRKALPDPDVSEQEYVAPEGATETAVAAIVAEMLGMERVSITSNLITLGMPSILMMKLAMRVSKELDVQIRVKDIMAAPTVRGIAAAVDSCGNDVSAQIDVDYSLREYYPLTESQRGVYIDWEMNRGTTQYNISMLTRLGDGIDATRLAEALKRVIEAHPYLKAHLTMVDGDVMQQRRDDAEPMVTIKELDSEPDETFIRSLTRPFDLLGDDLYRIGVYRSPQAVWLHTDIHHIIFDGVSSGVLMRDIARAYEGEELKPEDFTSYENSLTEHALMHTDSYAEAEKHFDALVGGLESTLYPTSSQPDSTEKKAANATLSIPAEGISEYCRSNGVTHASHFRAALMCVLRCVTREDDVLITTINNGRTDARMQDSVGMLVKTLPVAMTGVGGKPTFAETALALQRQVAESADRSICPFTHIASRHGVRPNIMYAYQGLRDYEDDQSDGLFAESEPVYMELDTVKVPLMLQVMPETDSFQLLVEYDASMYGRDDMDALLSMVGRFAQSAAESADMNITDIPLVGESEQTELIALGRGATMDCDTSDTLVSLLAKQVSKTPDATAIVFEDRTYTYRELDELSTRLAAKLQGECNVKAESVVGVMIDRSEWLVIYPLAVMKAGGAYMPLDFHFPAERLQFMIDDAGVNLILSEGDLADKLTEFKGTVLRREDLSLEDCDATEMDAAMRAKPENAFVVLYTSGTTGTPKGVVLEHRNIVNFCHWYVDEFDMTAEDRALAYSNFGFDAHMMDFYPALSCGASAYVISSAMRMDLPAMNAYMEANGLNIAFMTTQIGHLFASGMGNKSLRQLSVGGEKLPPVKKPDFSLYNGYGPTECTLFSTFYPIAEDYASSLIGRPLANYSLYVVDKAMRLVPRGVAGELVVAGAGVGRCYLNRPELTADKFVMIDGRRGYRTGDLVRWSDDGNIEYLGRIDNQVKLRGLRIELGEIESKVAAISGVKQAAAVVKNLNGTDHIVLYYAAAADTAGQHLAGDSIKDALKTTSLAEYMIPDVYMQLDTLPLTPNGKVNRKALPVPQVEARAAGLEASTEDERFFCETFKQVLGVEEVYADDNFFELGGSSLLATRMLIVANKSGRKLTYAQVFDNPTPQKLAALFDSNLQVDSESQPGNELFNLADYDYTAINALLAGNTLEAFCQGERLAMGDVLLIGATGFAGIHVLHELVHNYDMDIYCPVRKTKASTFEVRLNSLYYYYFSEKLDEVAAGRMHIFDGDITKPETLEAAFKPGVTVINCAANVKHFSVGTDIEDINYYGVVNLIDLCKKHHAVLIQTSTLSVMGTVPADSTKVATEQDLWFGQDLGGNKYSMSKFAAERAVLEAHARGEIIGKVIRLGNLAPRETDGEFQINFRTNGFMNRLKTIRLLGCYPYSLYDVSGDISPIDFVARAIVLFAQTPKDCVLFHGDNSNRINLGNFFSDVADLRKDLRVVEMPEFLAAFEEAKKDAAKLQALTGFLAYENTDTGRRGADYKNRYSTQVLLRMGFRWPVISQTYIDKFLRGLALLGFFDV